MWQGSQVFSGSVGWFSEDRGMRQPKRDFLVSSEMDSENPERTEDAEKTATLRALRVIGG
jgi:hypothetical protein